MFTEKKSFFKDRSYEDTLEIEKENPCWSGAEIGCGNRYRKESMIA